MSDYSNSFNDHIDAFKWISALCTAIPEAKFMVLGPPGIGKTAWAKSLAKQLKDEALLQIMVMSSVDATALSGVTLARTDPYNRKVSTQIISHPSFKQIYDIQNKFLSEYRYIPNAVLVLEEITNSPDNVQKAVLNCISTGCWYGLPIRNLSIVATGNTDEHSHAANAINEALRRRFCILNIGNFRYSDLNEYFTNLMNNVMNAKINDDVPWSHPEIPSLTLIRLWSIAISQVLADITKSTDEVITQANNDLDNSYTGWDCPASRDALIQALAVLFSMNAPDKVIGTFVCGYIGNKPGNKLMKDYNLLERIINLKDKIDNVFEKTCNEIIAGKNPDKIIRGKKTRSREIFYSNA
ncbi:MAG: AAA family ATPase [Methylacidiphilales bacterium]|nr:AAA family ATPase [Candidatus Methylacidiphilales bacterium]